MEKDYRKLKTGGRKQQGGKESYRNEILIDTSTED